MQPVNLFDLAGQQARWLAVRQASTASNIANVHTPEYRATDIQPFESVVNNTSVSMRTTNANHLLPVGHTDANYRTQQTDDPVMMPSGNNVSIENELMKAGEVRREYQLNTAIVKSFHRMMMMTTAKG